LNPVLTPLLEALIFFTLTAPSMGLIGRKVWHEKIAVLAYVTFALVFSLTLIPIFYSEVSWRVSVLTEHGSADPFLDYRVSVALTLLSFSFFLRPLVEKFLIGVSGI